MPHSNHSPRREDSSTFSSRRQRDRLRSQRPQASLSSLPERKRQSKEKQAGPLGGPLSLKEPPPSPPLENLTDPFPEDLLRLPFPDKLVSVLPSLQTSSVRSLLALVQLSFRFENGKWQCLERSFTTSEVASCADLTGQGTRDGLAQLNDEGLACTDKSGHAHRHKLQIEVPEDQFTFLPLDFFRESQNLSGPEIQVLLFIFRATWGWTISASQANSGTVEHKRWARLPSSTIAEQTGFSATAVQEAIQSLEQRSIIERSRPDGGAYLYLPRPNEIKSSKQISGAQNGSEAQNGQKGPIQGAGLQAGSSQVRRPHVNASRGLKAGSTATRLCLSRTVEGPVFFSMTLPNEMGASSKSDGNSHLYRENRLKEKTKQRPRARGERCSKRKAERRRGVLREDKPIEEGRAPKNQSEENPKHTPSHKRANQNVDTEELSKPESEIANKLSSVGVWPSSIKEIIRKFSLPRIEANFEYFRKAKNSKKRKIKNDAAFLTAAIKQGYILPKKESLRENGPNSCAVESGSSNLERRRRPSKKEKRSRSGESKDVSSPEMRRSRPNSSSQLSPQGASSESLSSSCPSQPVGNRRPEKGSPMKASPKKKHPAFSSPKDASTGDSSSMKKPSPGTKVTEDRMEALVEAGLASTSEFTRCLSKGPEAKYFYRLESKQPQSK